MLITDPISDPFFNLAAEEFLLKEVRRPLLRLWRSSRSVVIGRHQIPDAEVNKAIAETNGVPILRRLSGGGAVYHDMGNVNFTLVTDRIPFGGINFDLLMTPIVAALNLIGVPAEHVGRGDLRLEGKKISGDAIYLWKGCTLHHGTLLFNADLDLLDALLDVPDDGQQRPKSIRSVRSPVINIESACKGRFADIDAFMNSFGKALSTFLAQNPLDIRHFTDEEKKRINEIADAIYRRPEWNESGKLPQTV
jgi:lipoate-protein ligase A